MKRLLLPVLSLLLAAALCACQAGPVVGASSNSVSSAPVSSQPTSSAPTSSTPPSSIPVSSDPYAPVLGQQLAQGIYYIKPVGWVSQSGGLSLHKATYYGASVSIAPRVETESIEFASDGSVLAEKLKVQLILETNRPEYTVPIKQISIYRADENGNKLETEDAKLLELSEVDPTKNILLENVPFGEKLYLVVAKDEEAGRHIYETVVYWEVQSKTYLYARFDCLCATRIPLNLVDVQKESLNLETDYEISPAVSDELKANLNHFLENPPKDLTEEILEKLAENLPKAKRIFYFPISYDDKYGYGWDGGGEFLHAIGMILEDGTTWGFTWFPMITEFQLGDDLVSATVAHDSMIGLKEDGTVEALKLLFHSEYAASELVPDVFYDSLSNVAAVGRLGGFRFLLRDGTFVNVYEGSDGINHRSVRDVNVVKLEQRNRFGEFTCYLKTDNKIYRYNSDDETSEPIAEVEDWTKVSAFSVSETEVNVTLKDGTTKTIALK